jgi:hypothetical protein
VPLLAEAKPLERFFERRALLAGQLEAAVGPGPAEPVRRGQVFSFWALSLPGELAFLHRDQVFFLAIHRRGRGTALTPAEFSPGENPL